MKTKFRTILHATILAFLVVPLATWAQDEKAEEKAASNKTEAKSNTEAKTEAKAKPKAKAKKKSTVSNEFNLGLYYLSDDSYRYGKYSGLTNSGVYALVDFRLEKRPEWNSGDATRWRFEGWRVGLDSRRVEFDFHQQGKQRFQIDYRQTPNNNWRDGETIYLGAGSENLTLPDGWEIAPGTNNTRGFIKLDDYLNPVKMKTDRKSITLEYDLKLGANWNMSLDYKHDVKDGTRATWGVIGRNSINARAAGIPAPVDWQTDNFEAMFTYAAGRFQFGAGVYASFFNNNDKSVTWQTAFGKVGNWGDGTGYPDGSGMHALEPDNSYLQFKMYGGMNFSGRTRLTADFSYGSMKQNDAFFPYTVNPDLNVPIPLPQNDADAKINMTMVNLRLTSRLARNLNLSVNYHYDDRNNKTPRAADGYPYVSADSEDQKRASEARLNLPFSYTNNKVDAILNWRVARGTTLKGGVIWNDYSRDYAEVEDSDEFTYLAGIRVARWETASLSLDYKNSDRDIDEYIGNRPYILSYLPGTKDADDWENHPLLRKFNQTDRKRQEWRFRLDWFPTTQANFGITGQNYEDEYDENAFGLNEAEANSWTIDAGWYPSEKIVMTAFYTKETWESEMAGRSFISDMAAQAWVPEQDWWNESKDDVKTYNLHLGFKNLGKSEGIRFGLEYTYSNVESKIITTGAANINTAPLPELVNKLQSFRAYGAFEINEKSSIRLTAESSKLRVDDFALDNVEPDTMANVLSFGQATADYDLWLITASWNYLF